MYRILIVEDDPDLAEGIAAMASSWNLKTRVIQNFQLVYEEYVEFDPHLILMDITLPFFNGYYWCGEIRKISKVPIIFISSASDNLNIVMAMNMGADDFIAKPFDTGVLMAKINALLRRSYDYAPAAPILSHRSAILDTGSQSLSYQDNRIALTKNEYRILYTLLVNKGSAVSREKLMQSLWETDLFVDDNTLTVNVNRLRKKLDGVGLENFILTRTGVGYCIENE